MLLHIANKILTLSYHTDLLDDHVPLVRDILGRWISAQSDVFKIEHCLIIDVGGGNINHHLSTTQKQHSKRQTELPKLQLCLEGADTDLIHPYKRFAYEKSIKYAGSTVGDPLNISDLVNNQGIVAVSELATEIKQQVKQ